MLKLAFFFRKPMSLSVKLLARQHDTLIERDTVEGGWRLVPHLREGSQLARATRSNTHAPSSLGAIMTRSKSPPLPHKDPSAPYPPTARAPRVAMPLRLPITTTTLQPHAWAYGAGRMVATSNGNDLAAFMRVQAPLAYEGVTREAFVENVKVFRKAMSDAGGCGSCCT